MTHISTELSLLCDTSIAVAVRHGDAMAFGDFGNVA